MVARWLAGTALVLTLVVGGAASARDGARHTLKLINDSPVRLQEFWIATTTGESEDALGAAVVPAGESLTLDLDPAACRYDFVAVFADGRRPGRYNYDACANPEVRLGALLGEDLLNAPSGGGPVDPGAAVAVEAAGSAMPPPPPPPPPMPAAAMPPSPAAGATAPAPGRGVPICPGDARCKRRP